MSKLFNEMENFDKVEKKISGWTLRPVEKAKADPLEIVELNSGYAIEQYQWENYHQALALTPDKELKKLFARISLEEEEHISMLGSLMDPRMSMVESSLAIQMTAIHQFTAVAQLETNESLRNTYDYMLLDHLTQMRILSDAAINQGANPEEITKGLLRTTEGRPFENQFIPMDSLFKQPLDKNTVDVASFVNAHTILANEIRLRNDFQTFRRIMPAQDVRRLLNMISAVENLHIIMLESLLDPTISLLENAVINELMEIKNHRLGIQLSKHKDIISVHEHALRDDEVHLGWLRDTYSDYGLSESFQPTDKLFAQPAMSAKKYIDHVIDRIHQTI